MRGVPLQSVCSTSSTLALFSAASLQVYWSLLFQALAVGIKRIACRLKRLRVGDDLSLT